MTNTHFKKRAAVVAVASCLTLAPWLAEAAGLGRITVLSGLGQPLRAEVEVSATPTEVAGMTARLAPPQAFREAGIEFASSLLDLRFAVEKRGKSGAVVKVTSNRPVNDPFLDFLVELNWQTGSVVREYTFLLDPPELAPKMATSPVSTAEARVVDTVRGAGAVPASKAEAVRSESSPPRAVAPAPRKADAPGTHVVQSGETLRRIAGETKYDGVSLEQMMVGLFRANPNAFVGDNVNRLKAGAILNVPDKATVAAVPPAEARQVYVAQVGDWNRYRQGVATAAVAAPAKEAQPAQAASGKVTAKVEEKVAPEEQVRDQVKVARTEVPAKGAGDKPGAAEEDLVAKDRALKEAQERLAMLEKNVVELQKLVDLKEQRLAELQAQAAGKDTPVAVAPAAAAKPSEPAPAAEPPKAAEAPPPAEPPKPAAEALKAPEVKPPEPPKPAPAPAPAAEPGLIDQLLDNPLALAAGGGVLALLAGLFMAKRRREEQVVEMSATAPNPSSLGPNSVFRMTGGQSVDTANMPMPTGEFSQTGPGTIDTDEVDPVAEADVYMAYGRDAQAEEILVEALRKDPQRLAIHAKLLEIYANRKSLKQFDTLASELYSQTGGVGPEWEKVAALGLALDPENPLYASDRRPREDETGFMDDAAFAAAPAVAAAAVAVPGALGMMADDAEQPAEEAAFPAIESPEASFDAAAADLAEATSAASAELDFDLAGAAPLVDEAAAAIEPVAPVVQEEFGTLDFDLGQSASTAVADAGVQFTPEGTMIIGNELPAASEDAALLDFELDAEGGAAETMVNPAAVQEAMVGDLTVVDGMAGLSVEFAEEGLQFEGKQDDAALQVQVAPVPEFDMASINLDLSAEGPGSAAPVAPADNAGFDTGGGELGGDDVGTKLALAKAYEEMGDLDQACELLEEVIAEGSGDVVEQAKQTIARLRG